MIPSLDFAQRMKEPVYQMMAGVRPDQYAALMEGAFGADLTAWWPRAADIIPKGVGKGEALRQICAHLGCDPAEVIAFGDGGNDVSMLKAAGTGIAMGNAPQDVKDQADAVCGSVTEDGIFRFFHGKEQE